MKEQLQLRDARVYWISPKLPLWFIKRFLWRAEGADSPEELQKVFDSIYKREVSEDELFYIHFLKFQKYEKVFE